MTELYRDEARVKRLGDSALEGAQFAMLLQSRQGRARLGPNPSFRSAGFLPSAEDPSVRVPPLSERSPRPYGGQFSKQQSHASTFRCAKNQSQFPLGQRSDGAVGNTFLIQSRQ